MGGGAAFLPASEGTLLWEASDNQKASSNLSRYLSWLGQHRGLRFGSYDDLWRWSVSDLDAFWGSIWDFFQLRAHRPSERVLEGRATPGAIWFVGAKLNYAEHALGRRDDHPAIIFSSETRPPTATTYAELYREVARVAGGLKALGVKRGDRVAAYMPNIPETLIAFLAVASVGAIWSSCAPDFGTRSVIDRFRQIEPRLLIAVDGYHYGGKAYDRLPAVREIQQELPTLEGTVIVPYLASKPALDGMGSTEMWSELSGETSQVDFAPVPFGHPLWVLYSSGTTGLPKAIVQGHGGILLEHLKSLSLHLDLTPDDRWLWFTPTGWMMWNFLMSGLLLGASIVMYDGNPSYPDMRTLWRLCDQAGITYFGTSAPFILSCMKAGIRPGREFNLGPLKGVGSTGAPLTPEGFQWVYEAVKRDVLLGSVSGGTDVCTAFIGPCLLLPVCAGEIQCRMLGASVEAYDASGRSLVDEVGELVVTEPMPSMPLFLWNDPDGSRYRESYFATFPGVWRHGDWIKITSRGSCVVYGRSDSTLNRGGVRMGTSEFYRVVEEMSDVVDSLAVDTGSLGREGRLILFVALREEIRLDDQLKGRINDKLRRELSPRHVPDEIYQIPEVPRTLNGKKLEVPVKRILMGTPPEKAVSVGAMINPQSLRRFVELAKQREGAM